MHVMNIPAHLTCRLIQSVLCVLLITLLNTYSFSQKNSIKGIVTDTTAKTGLHYSIIALIDLADTTLYKSVRSTESGGFEINKIPPGRYTVMISYPGMGDYLQDIIIKDTSEIDLKRIVMVPELILLQEIVVRSGVAIRMRGDTLEYTADSFALRPGSKVEELLKRLPGIQVDKNHKITAQGKEVQNLLVDGDEFFSDDPGLAMKYLNADAVDKVQVFDKKSEQSEFTGIDDGSRTKTINLKLKKDKKNGYFGKLETGSDVKKYYNHEAMAALFNGGKKMSVFGLVSRTGKAGLSGSELSNYVAQDYERIEDGTGSIYYSSNDEYEGDGYYGSGLPSVIYGGAHYSDKWKGGKQKLFSNYRVKQINTAGWSNNSSTTVLPDGTGFSRRNDGRESSHNFIQKASGNFSTQLDSFSVLKISANGSLGNSTRSSSNVAESKNEKGFFVNKSIQSYYSLAENKRFGTNISYQRKFRKIGRTFSLVFQQDYNNNNTDNNNYSEINLYDPGSGVFKNADTLDQLQKTLNRAESYAAKAMYTDKLSKQIGVSVEYGWKTGLASNLFNTFNGIGGKYQELVDTLSNDYRFTVNTNIAGTALSWNGKKINISVGTKVFFTGFEQVNNDTKEKTKRRFANFAPSANMTIHLKETSSFSFNYSGQTFQPTVDQLQPLRKSSNQLYVQIGNPGLKPGFGHAAGLNYNWFDWVKGKNIYASVNMNYATNNITNKTITDAQGRTISQYINMRGIPGISGHIGYNWQYKKIKLRPAISASISRYGNYYIINNEKVKNESLISSTNLSLQYDLANKFTANYQGVVNYNVGWSNIANNKTNRNLSHTHHIEVTGYLPAKMEINSDCSFTFQPKNKAFDSHLNMIQWDAWLQKKLFKNEQVTVKLSINDILNQNTGYHRSVYGSNVSESNRLVIKRYWLLTIVWNFAKSINKGSDE
jgi:hypothetical protein